ncbi:hypothetical protein Tco_1042354 [Tanacetum coccineum]|uniref:Uncharacterized protein n=1 Tax=Tanacetum coccineum TaxID=301880 RepID=A0ABQ5GJZ1_9ASTR
MLELILHQQQTLISALNVDSLKVDLVVIQNTCSEKEDSNSETASSKSVKESSLNSETKDVHAIKYKMSKSKERCACIYSISFIHTFKVLSKDGFNRPTRIGIWIQNGICHSLISMAALLGGKQPVQSSSIQVYLGIMTVKWLQDTYFVNTLARGLNTSEINYSNTWVMLSSPLLKNSSSIDSMKEG